MDHPLLRPETVEDREYQRLLTARLLEGPHLLVLPTGLGKTVVALRVLLHHLQRDATRRVLILAPTKPLCDQHARFLRQVLLTGLVSVFTGDTAPVDRDRTWAASRVVVATPQVVQNDVIRGARDLADVSFIVYDEAHRATGDYPYAFLAERYRAAGGRDACGLTASPGNDPAAVHRILRALHLERVEVRTEKDPDVAPHVHAVETEWVRVRPTLHAARCLGLLSRMFGRCVVAVRRLGYLPHLRGLPGRKDLLQLGIQLRAEASRREGGRGVYEAVSLQARALKLHHAVELAETQGTASLHRFLLRLQEEAATSGGSKAARDIVREPEFVDAVALARDDPEPAPKQARIAELVATEFGRGARRILVFANFRDTADDLVARLGSIEGVRASRFVGHARNGEAKGLTRREQEAVVERFRTGDLNVLVATAVGEEGLDLPETDAVILHEPVPSGIRFIQRRGRTGRRSDGRLYVLLTEGTRDESYHWNALRRERRMNGSLAALKRIAPLPSFAAAPSAPAPRASPSADLTITMDGRESGSPLARTLLERGVRLRTEALPTGDYAISDRILVERKTATDFAASLQDGRLFDQLPRLAAAGLGVLLIEGDPFRTSSGIAPAALAGAIAAAATDHRVTVITVPDAIAAADLLVSMARREHREGRPTTLRIAKAPRMPDDQLRFVLEGMPRVGPVTARRLLERFGSVAALAAASVESLAETDGVGPETARNLHALLHRRFGPAPADLPSSVAPPMPPTVASGP